MVIWQALSNKMFLNVIAFLFICCVLSLITKAPRACKSFCDPTPPRSEATFVRRDFVTTLVQTWLTCWLSLQPFVALHCQTEHSSVIWFDQNSGFLLEAPFHILPLIFSRARHWRHWGSWLLPPRSFPYDPLPRHAAWNWYLGTGTVRSRQGISRAV